VKRRSAAADAIRDAAILERLALTAPDGAVRHTAARRRRDGERIERLARAADPDVRAVAVSKLLDSDLLQRLLDEEKDQRIRAVIETRLLDDDVLAVQASRPPSLGHPTSRSELTAAGRASPLAQVETLEAEICFLRKSLG
jgi:hypothetical protein